MTCDGRKRRKSSFRRCKYESLCRRGNDGQGEIGKIWERGRNWVSIVVEVVPASLRTDLLSVTNPGKDVDTGPLKEDEDMLEVPMFVRVEWEADAAGDGAREWATLTREQR